MSDWRHIFRIFHKGFLLYLILGLLFVWLVDEELAFQNRLTGLKHAEEELKEFEAGRGEMDLQVLSRALRYYHELLKRMPKAGLVYGDLGFCYYYLGRPGEAINQYQKAIELDPFWYTYDWDLGVIYHRLGDYPKSLKHLKQAAEHLDEAVYQYKLMSHHFHVQGREDVRNEALRMLLRVQEDEVSYFILTAENHFRLGQVGQMLESALGGVKNHPDRADLHFQAGRAVLALADCRGALPYFQRALELKASPSSAAFYARMCRQRPQASLKQTDEGKWVLRPGEISVPEEKWDKFRLHINADLILMRYLTQE